MDNLTTNNSLFPSGFTAKAARKITELNAPGVVREYIDQACRSGYSICFLSKELLNESIIRELTDRGFSVKILNTENSVSISW